MGKTTIVHNSMALNTNNKYGFKVGDIVEGMGEVVRITMAGEIMFPGGNWSIDRELIRDFGYRKVGKIWKRKKN